LSEKVLGPLWGMASQARWVASGRVLQEPSGVVLDTVLAWALGDMWGVLLGPLLVVPSEVLSEVLLGVLLEAASGMLWV